METAAPAKAAQWLTMQERSNKLALSLMAHIAVLGGRRVARCLLPPITLYYLCFAGQARRQSKRYLALALGRQPTFRDQYRHIHTFASVVLDRVYFARGQTRQFDLRLSGIEELHATLDEGRGAFLLGAHLGSFEALHAIGATRPGMKVAHVMFPDNARLIQGALQAMAPDFHLSIITIGRPGSTLEIRDWLDAGGLVGLLGDRWLPKEAMASAVGRTEASRTTWVQLPFLGPPAPFIDGPLRLAQLLRRRVLFMVGLYRGGNRYDLCFEVLADFSSPPRDAAAREQLLQQALRDYVSKLETLCKEHPYNWFNFYDFWHPAEQPA